MAVSVTVDKAADDLVLTTGTEGAQKLGESTKASSQLAPQLDDITKSAEGAFSADEIRFTVQVQDAMGVNLAGRFVLDCWVSVSDFGDATGATDINNANANRLLKDGTSYIRVVTASDGSATIDVLKTGAATLFFMAAIAAKTKSLSATWAA